MCLIKLHEAKTPLEDLEEDGTMILEWILGKEGEEVWTEFILLRTGTSGRLLWTR